MSACPTPSTNSYVIIDEVFQVNAKFFWIDGTPIIGQDEIRSWMGDLFVYSRYQKEKFTLEFPDLSEDEMNQLKQICRQVGVNAFHTVKYSSRSKIMLWDSVTQPGYGINIDVQRVRKKVKFDAVEFPHHPGDAIRYSCVISCTET